MCCGRAFSHGAERHNPRGAVAYETLAQARSLIQIHRVCCVETIGAFSEDIGSAELTGTGTGQLFGFGIVQGAPYAHIAEIDKADAAILTDDSVPTSDETKSWAFAAWGGGFYFFTSTDGASSVVARLHDGTYDASYATLPGEAITGAGVSTCAPH